VICGAGGFPAIIVGNQTSGRSSLLQNACECRGASSQTLLPKANYRYGTQTATEPKHQQAWGGDIPKQVHFSCAALYSSSEISSPPLTSAVTTL